MPSDPRDYKLELSSPAGSAPGGEAGAVGRPFLSLLFACCNVYSRVYREPRALEYLGRCPKCGVAVRFRVGEGGTDSRFFVVR